MKSKIIAIAIILFALEIDLNAAQIDRTQNNYNITLKHLVNKYDKMKILKAWHKYNFKFKLLEEKILNYVGMHYYLNSNLKKLFEASNTSSWKKLRAFLSGPFIEKPHLYLGYKERIKLFRQAEKLIYEAAEDFSKACREDSVARKRINDVYLSLISDIIKKEVEYEENKHKKLLFLNFVFGLSAAGNENTISPDASSSRGLFNAGLRVSYYFKHPYDNFNLGFAFQVSYMNVFDLTKGENEFTAAVKYIDLMPLFIVKVYGGSRNHSLHVGLGPVFSARIGGLKNYTTTYSLDTYTYDIKSFVYGGIAEIGYIYTSSNLGFNLFLNLFVRFDKPHFSKYVNSVKENTDKALFVGFSFGIGFNLL